MRFCVTLGLMFCACLGTGYGDTLRFSSDFVSQFYIKWNEAGLDQQSRGMLLGETKQLFDVDFPPRFPGLSSFLIDESRRLASLGDEVGERTSLLLACTVAECDAATNWRLFWGSITGGNWIEALTSFSQFVVSLPQDLHWVSGGLGVGALLGIALSFGSFLFVVVVIVRHAYSFGTALCGRLPAMSAGVFALTPILATSFLLLAGFGVTSLVVGLLMVLPLVKRREAIWTLAVILSLGCLTIWPRGVPENLVADGFELDLHKFSTSARQRLIAFQALDTRALERQIVDDLRLLNLNRARRQMEELRSARSEIYSEAWAAGLVNLEGIAQALSGKSSIAIALFREAAELAPSRFEPKYNQIKVLKMQNKDDEAQALLATTLALDTRQMGNRVAADFNYSRDLEGFAVFVGHSMFNAVELEPVISSLRQGHVFTQWLAGELLTWKGGWWTAFLVLLAFGLSQFIERRYQLFFPCSGCAEATLQSKSVYENGGLDCELCLMDVSTASKLERVDLNRHHRRVDRWRTINQVVDYVSVWLLPPLMFFRNNSPGRALLSLCLLTGFSIGVWLSVLVGVSFAVNLNAILLVTVWLTSGLSARRMETR